MHSAYAELIACEAGASSTQLLLQQGLQVTCSALYLYHPTFDCSVNTTQPWSAGSSVPPDSCTSSAARLVLQDAHLPLLDLEDVMPATMGVQLEPPVDAGRS